MRSSQWWQLMQRNRFPSAAPLKMDRGDRACGSERLLARVQTTQVARLTNDLNQQADTRVKRDLGSGICRHLPSHRCLTLLRSFCNTALQPEKPKDALPDCPRQAAAAEGRQLMIARTIHVEKRRGPRPTPSGVLKEQDPMYAACTSCHPQASEPA